MEQDVRHRVCPVTGDVYISIYITTDIMESARQRDTTV